MPIPSQVEIGNQTYSLLPNTKLPEGYEGPTALLGKGMFGTVSVAMAIDNINHDITPVAVKVLQIPKYDPDSPEESNPKYAALMAETEKEIRLMKKLGRQADMIEIPSDDPKNATLLIFQPLIKGKELAQYFDELQKKAQLEENQNDGAKLQILNDAVASFIAAMEAVKELHNAKIIHGDLHTGNILYDASSKTARIIDFGLSQELPEGHEKVFVAGDAEISNIHCAPEAVTATIHPGRDDSERVYSKSSDAYSLAIDCGVGSDFTDYAPDFAGRETVQLLRVFKEMSQSQFLGGNEDPQKRITIDEGIESLKAIRAQIEVRIAQKRIFELPNEEIKKMAQQFAEVNSFRNQARENSLPPDMKAELKKLAKQMKARQSANKRAEAKKELLHSLPAASASLESHKRARAITPFEKLSEAHVAEMNPRHSLKSEPKDTRATYPENDENGPKNKQGKP
jgi:serine/threonine protein kinase